MSTNGGVGGCLFVCSPTGGESIWRGEDGGRVRVSESVWGEGNKSVGRERG